MAFADNTKPTDPAKIRIKKGDTVEVITGKDVGKRGAILLALPREHKIVVAGVNIITKHTKDRPIMRPGAMQPEMRKGGRLQSEAPMATCKVMLVCPNCQRPTRVGYAYHEGEGKMSRRKYRVCKHSECGKSVDIETK